jgi:2-C-methyl-D-erythritol 2,4-cyclodiphosphate synthase
MRAGVGFDAHPFVEGRPLVLGGVEIPHARGLGGHSDGDVLAHAVIDAVLGAASLGDIGEHFPPDDPATEGADSLDFVRRTSTMVRDAGHSITSVDAVVVAEEPRIARVREEIRTRLAGALGVEAGVVSVKGTTTDGMGFTGRGEGIAAIAVALLG